MTIRSIFAFILFCSIIVYPMLSFPKLTDISGWQNLKWGDDINRVRDLYWPEIRLPTVNELMSILNPPGEDFCLEPVFSPHQKWLWSADRRSFRSAWYVDAEMGFVSSHDITGFFHVKAVCDII